MLTLTDAKHGATVRRALETALVSGVARPRLHFGLILVRLQGNGQWSVRTDAPAHNLTTDDAIALIVSTARGI